MYYRSQTLADLQNYQNFIKKYYVHLIPGKMWSDETMHDIVYINLRKIHFKNWVICGVLHVKNLFNENGIFIARNEYTRNKSSWLWEYIFFPSVFKPLWKIRFFNFSKSVNLDYKDNLLLSNGYTSDVIFFTKTLSVENSVNLAIKEEN